MPRSLGSSLSLLLVLALVMPTLGLQVSAAADSDFGGGPIPGDYPTLVPNDHTPMAMRFTASGLLPNAVYEIKIRMAPSPTPSEVESRGYVWNPNKASWTFNHGPAWNEGNFPTVTTDENGDITEDDCPWVFFKFGNELDSGTYHILVSLNNSGEGTTRNASVRPEVTVLDMKAEGTRVHDGTLAVTTTENERSVVVASSDSTDNANSVLSITRSELNTVDDDSNGVTDDEDYGQPGASGDYLLAASAGTVIDLWVEETQKVNDFAVGGPDEDIALGAADTSAPTSPTALGTVADPTKISLSWHAATDNTGVAGYRIYRWADVSDGVATPVHELIGTTSDLTFDDMTAITGVVYNYEVRSLDASTNVSARSDTTTALVVNQPPAAVDDEFLAIEDAVLSVPAPGVLSNDADANGDDMVAAIVTETQHGSVDLSPDGGFVYTPNADYYGPDSFTYVASDALSDSTPATVHIVVGPVNDAPVAMPDTYAAESGTPLVVDAPGVLENDSDADDDDLTAVKDTGPAHGDLTLNPDGSFIYTPVEDFIGSDSFTYFAHDGQVSSVDPALVTINVTRATATIDDQAAGVTFDRWVSNYNAAYSDGSYVYGRWTGTTLEMKFVGNKIRWVGPKQPNYGKADVYIDDDFVQAVDCYAPSDSATLSTTLFQSGTLPEEGVHTLRIRLGGAKNPESSGYVVVVDRFEAEGLAPSALGFRIDERVGSATFGGTWVKPTNIAYFDKGYAYSRWSGTYYKAWLTGTKVAWIGPKWNNYGYADIYIDNVKVARVDCYAAAAPTNTMGWRYAIWESATLSPGTHSIVIRPTGTKRAASTGTIVVVDALDVAP